MDPAAPRAIVEPTDPAAPPPRVSVCVLTYNHRAFIEKALDSVLAQQTTFPFEVVVADDCSTDGARAIVESYEARHPGVVRMIRRPHNVGIGINYVEVLEAARGEYTAYLEGDDYWLGTDKLQKQVDFLDTHPDHVLSFHNAVIDTGDGITPASRKILAPGAPRTLTLEDLLARGNSIPSCSFLYRTRCRPVFPPWFSGQSLGDWTLHVMIARHGLLGYLDETMAVIRHHPGGVWTGANQRWKLDGQLRAYALIDAFLGHRYTDLMRPTVAALHLALVELLAAQGDQRGALSHYLAALPLLPSIRPLRPLASASLALFPPALGAFRRAKELAASLRR
jgi:glycosyltransferase involved in cell wall biosynthesis